jgi:hypothetical protein
MYWVVKNHGRSSLLGVVAGRKKKTLNLTKSTTNSSQTMVCFVHDLYVDLMEYIYF